MAKVTASTIIKMAESFIGTKESPPDSNNVSFNTHYYGRQVEGSAYPWCVVFVWDVFRLCGASELFYGGNKTASTGALRDYAIKHNQYYSTGKSGDIGIMNFGSGGTKHTVIVKERRADGQYITIEGNTSLSSNDNGGCVMERTRPSYMFMGFYRPNYKASVTSTVKQATASKKEAYSLTDFVKEVQAIVKAKIDGVGGKETLSKTISLSTKKNAKHSLVRPIQKRLNAIGYSCGTVDGIYGSKTEKAVKNYQKKVIKMKNPDGEITAGCDTWKYLLGIKR